MKNKKILSLIVSTTLFFSVASTSFAASNNSSYYNYLSKFTGKSVTELLDIENKYGDLSEYFDLEIPNEVINSTSENTVTEVTSSAVSKDSEVSQATKKDSGYYDALASYTGMSVTELKKLEKEHGDLNKYFGLATVKKTKDAETSGEVAASSTQTMTSSQWSYMKDKADKGDILISKDQTTYVLWVIGINHGHAAIVYTDSSRTVEALGDPYNSDDYDISRWANRYTMRDYYPPGYYTFRENAADYAYNNLQGKPYKATANRTDTEYLQCANLVWQAYKSEGTTLDYAPAGWATPMTFVQDTDLTLWAQVNWNTGDHTW